jgi:hypothetical protein
MAQVAVLELADKIAHDATPVTRADVDRLQTLGLGGGRRGQQAAPARTWVRSISVAGEEERRRSAAPLPG